MRILQFGRYDFDEIKGGVQFYAEILTRHLEPEIQVDQLVSGAGRRTRVLSKGSSFKITLASYGLLASVPISPGIFYWAWKLNREHKYDIFHLNFPDPLALVTALFLPRKIPIIVTWHSDIVRQKVLLKFYRPFLKFFMKRVHAILVATPNHLASCPQLQELQMADKITVIPFGIDESEFCLKPAQEKKVAELRAFYPGKFLLFTFGRHVYYKGYQYLIEAMAKLPHCHLILGGSGPLTTELEKQIQIAGIQDRVELIGSIPFYKLPIYLHACDLFCFSSIDRTEAFGYAQVEAMVCGKAVITCNLENGINFVNLDKVTGLMVPPRDPDALAEAIDKLCRDPILLKQLSKSAQKRALEEFTASLTAARTATFFKITVAKHCE